MAVGRAICAAAGGLPRTSGIIIPTTRRAWQDDEQLVPAVAIDMGEITVR